MTEAYILTIDQGTTNSKASLVDATGAVLRETSRPVKIAYPQPGWVEQEPADLWVTVLAAAEEALRGCDLHQQVLPRPRDPGQSFAA